MEAEPHEYTFPKVTFLGLPYLLELILEGDDHHDPFIDNIGLENGTPEDPQ